MRYFVIMNDHTIKPATNVSKCENSGRVYFDVDGKMYRYLTVTREYSSRKFNRMLIPANAFQRFIHEDWYETREIKYLLALDEEENEEMNYFQSTDFNAGVMYTYVEKTVGLMLKDKGAISVLADFTIPAIQLIPKGAGSIQEGETIKATIKAATEHFEAVYGKNFNLNIYSWKMDKQYFKFEYSVKRKETYKEMTVAEIEEALGYKIKVVGDK